MSTPSTALERLRELLREPTTFPVVVRPADLALLLAVVEAARPFATWADGWLTTAEIDGAGEEGTAMMDMTVGQVRSLRAALEAVDGKDGSS